MNELLWLLLPVAAASGWLAARRSSAPPRQRGVTDLNPDYFRGLNFLLNEQPDKAIEVFIRMVEVDSETVETHLALGNLFRRRGEVDRAIRIHQNLIARPTLNAEQRSAALLELGQDYMRAGLFDRAESLLQELVDNDSHLEPALRHLLDIYQQEKEWQRAIDIARRLHAEAGIETRPAMAQFYCELAEQARSRGDLTEAGQLLKKALAQDRRCVRASLMQGELARESGDCKGAIRALRRVEEQDMEYFPEALPPLRECYEHLGNVTELIDYLHGVTARYAGVTPVLVLADLIRREQGGEAALAFIQEQLQRRPSVRGLARLIELNLEDSSGPARDNLLILKALADQLLADKPVYKCRHCGFKGKVLHWCCPSCKEWNTVKPIMGVEGE